MALIWVESCTGDKALAPLWRDFALADARQRDTTLPAEQRAAAYLTAEKAKMKFDAATSEALQALAKRAQANEARTHVLIVGVAQYDDPATFPNVSTSVHGARAFAEWMLTRFAKDYRPLGSLALVNSPVPDQGEWMPSKAAAERLGLAEGLDLPTEKATFANIKAAFEQFLDRAETFADNAAIFYFAGHGLFKSENLALAQDAQLPDDRRSAKNLIAMARTMAYMQKRQPSVQCFFVDACSEKNLELIQNVQEVPGEALIGPLNKPEISKRDANMYWGSYPGGKARGPANAAPFFTQELMLCLEKRASDPYVSSDDLATPSEYVTTRSLADALAAAGELCSERERYDIKFPHTRPGQNTFPAKLCEIDPVEVLVRIDYAPALAMGTAKLYVQTGADKLCRTAPHDSAWCTSVPKGDFIAGAEFDPPSNYVSVTCKHPARPPVHNVTLSARLAGATGRKS